MIVVVDYGMGNLRSVQKGFEKVGRQAVVSRDIAQISDAERLVLPGVGAFPECMRNLERYGLIDPILQFIDSGKPFLGICLGLQLLFDESEEFGKHEGLKIISGAVKGFDRAMGLKIPHMGWNQVRFKNGSPLFNGIEDGTFFYFVHSFYVDPTEQQDIAATSDYGIEFVCAISRGSVNAVQFHPEKSQDNGLRILQNFAAL